MINKDFKDNVTLINVIPLIIIPIGKDYSKIMFFIGLSILLVCTILEIGMLYKIGKENKKNIKNEEELIVLSILDSLMLLQYQPFLGLMVKCTPERGQKCSLFHLMVKCTPIIVELPSVYRGCKPLICFQ